MSNVMNAVYVELRERLRRASALMHAACADLDDTELRLQCDPEFSPIGWHLGHVAWQEETWLLRRVAGRAAFDPAFDELFDSFRPDKARRGTQLPSKSALLEYRARVRAFSLECFEQLLRSGSEGLMKGAGLVRFIANHESQHCETVLALRLAAGLAMKGPADCEADDPSLTGTPGTDYVSIPGGRLSMGSGSDPDRWDNECRPHPVEVSPFEMQRHAVSNGSWLEFVEAGGYEDDRLWSRAGWRFRRGHALGAPLYWRRDSCGQWYERTLAGIEPLASERPVCHVSWYEAEAFAAFSGARLPSEAEWEWAASGACEDKRRYPWGDAASDACDWALARLVRRRGGRRPETSSPQGVFDLMGGVWEWTSDCFQPYPGFEPQAYRGYSAPWFDGRHKVARGGAYVTQPEIARVPFRNWYLPSMRRAFTGVRLVRSGR